ncbi:MAG: FkbM family methyltransferase [Candidatus Adiutrix sp.]|jgi:FkbM family methyltransferase|nr:FkbM family methyltransferase [Candidatus Adiutrix sp.]
MRDPKSTDTDLSGREYLSLREQALTSREYLQTAREQALTAREQDWIARIQNIQSEAQSLTARLRDLTEEKKTLITENRELSSKLQNLTDENSELHTKERAQALAIGELSAESKSRQKLEVEARNLNYEVRQLSAEKEKWLAEKQSLTQTCQKLQAANQALEAEKKNLAAAVQRLTGEKQAAQQEARKQAADAVHFKDRLHRRESSFSWRLTRPLRIVHKKLKELRGTEKALVVAPPPQPAPAVPKPAPAAPQPAPAVPKPAPAAPKPAPAAPRPVPAAPKSAAPAQPASQPQVTALQTALNCEAAKWPKATRIVEVTRKDLEGPVTATRSTPTVAIEDYPLKLIKIRGMPASLRGVAKDDPYFKGLTDNMNRDLDCILNAVVPDDAVCMDLGANIGVTTTLISRHTPKGKVISIEAGPNIYELLNANIAANHLANVVTDNVAVGREPGVVSFFEHSTGGHVTNDGNGQPVPMVTLADLVAKYNIERLDFIKIDTEGNEFPIFENQLRLLQRFNPLIYMEFNAFVQLRFQTVNPYDFCVWVFENFKHVFYVDMIRKRLTKFSSKNPVGLLKNCLLDRRCVIDIVVTNNESYVKPLENLQFDAEPPMPSPGT